MRQQALRERGRLQRLARRPDHPAPRVPRCTCRAGFANGTCTVGWIADVRQYAGLCAVAKGNCDVDLDECLSRPCSAGTVCYDKSKDAVAPVSDDYRCEADAPDVDSCASNPCGNGAVCSRAAPSPPIVSVRFTLGCDAGVPVATFSNVRARDEFTVYDGDNTATAPLLLSCGGACANADRDGCNEPCTMARGSGSFLVVLFRGERSAPAVAAQHMVHYVCDVDECASDPCENDASCSSEEGAEVYSCTCVAGWGGDNCQDDIDECASTPCQNGAVCDDGAVIDSYVCSCANGWEGDNCQDTLAPPETFPGSQILSPTQQVTVSSWAPQGPTQQCTLCFSSFTDDASTPSVFHSQCDEYDVTMVVARHGAVPQTSFGLSSSPAWVEDAEWVFGGYVSASCLLLPCHVWSVLSLLALYCGLCLSSV